MLHTAALRSSASPPLPQARGDQAVQQILEVVPGAAGRIETLALEVTDDASVAAAAAAVAAKYPTEKAPLHGLATG